MVDLLVGEGGVRPFVALAGGLGGAVQVGLLEAALAARHLGLGVEFLHLAVALGAEPIVTHVHRRDVVGVVGVGHNVLDANLARVFRVTVPARANHASVGRGSSSVAGRVLGDLLLLLCLNVLGAVQRHPAYFRHVRILLLQLFSQSGDARLQDPLLPYVPSIVRQGMQFCLQSLDLPLLLVGLVAVALSVLREQGSGIVDFSMGKHWPRVGFGGFLFLPVVFHGPSFRPGVFATRSTKNTLPEPNEENGEASVAFDDVHLPGPGAAGRQRLPEENAVPRRRERDGPSRLGETGRGRHDCLRGRTNAPKFVETFFKLKSVAYTETAALKGKSMEVATEQTIKNVTMKMTMVYADDGNGTTTATGMLKAQNVPKMIRKTTEKYIRSQFESERHVEEGYL